MDKIIECVPNFSEGRDKEKIEKKFNEYRDIAIETLRKRLTAKNIYEADISPAGGRYISMRVPVVTKEEKATLEKLIKLSAKLQFRLVHLNNDQEVAKYLADKKNYDAPEGYEILESVETKDGKVIKKPYLVEIDYPDDAFRTFAISLRNQGDTSYPAAAGVETGHEYPLSNRMLTHTILSWFKEKNSRLIVANACDGQRGAISKIRVYRIENAVLPPLKKAVPAERGFSNWYEEGSGFMGLYGCDSRRKSLDDMIVGADRWAQTIAFIGGTTLYPTLMVYQFGLSPSHYNVFATGATRDLAEVILLSAEKYGMNVLFDFHPEARDLQLFEDQENRLRNREGFVSTFAPMHGPLHPRNQAWLCGMISGFREVTVTLSLFTFLGSENSKCTI